MIARFAFAPPRCDTDRMIRRFESARALTGTSRDGALVVIEDAVIVTRNGEIAWIGPEDDCPAAYTVESLRTSGDIVECIDVGGRLVSPALIDCHTHSIFAGWRANEFGMRTQGKSYADIAAAGGGIAATLRATRQASDDVLLATLVARADVAWQHGIATLEVKSGYDLTVAGELRLLRLIAQAGKVAKPTLVPTLLAHIVPADVAAAGGKAREAYVTQLCSELIPEVARQKLAAAVDVYCDQGAFTLDESERLWRAAQAANLATRGHVGQFSDVGAAALLAQVRARCADHLEFVSQADAAALAGSNVIGVMLPSACVTLGQAPPPVAMLRAAGVKLAIATDFNPGTSPTQSLAMNMWLAMSHFKMTLTETWLGVTAHAAAALGLADRGVLQAGARADIAVWPCHTPDEVPYRCGDLRPTLYAAAPQ